MHRDRPLELTPERDVGRVTRRAEGRALVEHTVGARWQLPEHERPVLGRHARARSLHLGRGNGHRHARDRQPLFIQHPPAEGAGLRSLGVGTCSKAAHDQRQQHRHNRSLSSHQMNLLGDVVRARGVPRGQSVPIGRGAESLVPRIHMGRTAFVTGPSSEPHIHHGFSASRPWDRSRSKGVSYTAWIGDPTREIRLFDYSDVTELTEA